MSYREIQISNSKNKMNLDKEVKKWLKNNKYKNVGWNNVINLYQKIQELINTVTLEELFLEADRIGNKYLTAQEMEDYNRILAQTVNQIAEEIDCQFPDTENEIIDFGNSHDRKIQRKHNQKVYRTFKIQQDRP